MRALVTGATGFVGKHLIRHLLAEGDEAFGTFLPAAREAASQRLEGATYIACDISRAGEVSNLISQIKPEAIYHLAGIAFVPEAEDDFDRALLINVGGAAQHLAQLPPHALRHLRALR